MPPNPPGPVLARKRIGTKLRSLREARGLTLDQVAGALLVSVSKLSRLENAQGVPQLRDVRDLVAFYEISDHPDGRSLMRWAQDGRGKGWWMDFRDVLRPEDAEFIGYENEATVCLQYSIPFMPGLLQTPEYTRSLISHVLPQLSADEVERRAETRRIRQQNLIGRDGIRPLELKVIIHEACLNQSVGSTGALRNQLVSLQASSKADNIDLRVLPADAQPHLAITAMWQHFSFGEDIDRDVVCMEGLTGYQYVDDEATVRTFERWFAELTRRSLDPVESVARIQDAINRIDS
jgi:transcriptional regulator with XRE-family HTH domain